MNKKYDKVFDFLRRKLRDKDLSQSVDRDLDVASQELMRAAGRNELRQSLENSHHLLVLRRRRRRLLWTLLTIALVLAGLYFLYGEDSKDINTLFAEHFRPHPNMVALRSDPAAEGMIAFRNAMRAYDKNRFDQVIDTLLKLEKQPHNLTSVQVFYLGVSLLASDRPKEAIERLTFLLKQEDFVMRKDAMWYLSLAHLLDGSKTNAVRQLDRLANTYPSYRSEEIKSILAEIQ